MSESMSRQHDAEGARAATSDVVEGGAANDTVRTELPTESRESDVMPATSMTGAAPSFPAPDSGRACLRLPGPRRR